MQNPLHKHKFPAVALGFFGLLEKLVILLSQLHDYPELAYRYLNGAKCRNQNIVIIMMRWHVSEELEDNSEVLIFELTFIV